MKFLSLLLFLFIVDIPLCHAYLITTTGATSDTKCEFVNVVKAQQVSIRNIRIDASQIVNLASGQYYELPQTLSMHPGNETIAFVVNCDEWGKRLEKTKQTTKISSSNTYATIKESSIIGASQIPGELNGDVSLFTTNIPGLFYYYEFSSGFSYRLPSAVEGTDTLSIKEDLRSDVFAVLVVNNEFRGVPEGASISSTAGQTSFDWYDANVTGGAVLTNRVTLNTIPPGEIKIIASCNYSLSNNGIVDFGDQNLSKVTNNRTTTVKKPLTLYMRNCYGVNKVKTYITNATTTLENGLLLGNTQTSNAATNVAIGINVAASSAKNSENNGSPMYMDGSNPLEWELGNDHSLDAISKEIPLDVFLLKSGGEPTSGDFKATATIMMDFI
ncbi:YadC family fimbrial protein [Rahnella aquatilis CIP 78.65 = ATCC 33071]|uniref:P pilus assembly protein, pilin FimA n=1 Tax=Rahnella aquatilis (strain ATCC 33071 / DSM 4594 / JCM 1683 / NBRC 105701 / NCIMB 13365 / CIP 78.65) TaxID=745277 RepID=H2IVA9_RAHAC|nr:fimbrial protein [Rahnella aquatilis]AEX50638.1 P pilus assembly protein, pilin FimA [Rahnella aquatilis CIP 78.65 = ATCC 33071]KFD01690.1 YadC family fimbrial protein [Rahnella aquatilis CIP 78.65 = ATCC 33071]